MQLKLYKYKSYFNTSLLYFGSSLSVSLIGILINPILAKNLSHEDYAIIGYFTSFQLLLAPLIGFNLTTYYLRNHSRIPEDRRKIVTDTLLIGLVFIGFLSFILFTSALYFYCTWAKVQFAFFPYAIYTMLQTYASVFFAFYLIKLRINRQAKKFAFLTITNAMVTTILTLILVVYYKQGAEGKLLSALIAAILIGTYSIIKSLSKWQFDFKILKEAFVFGLPLTISALFWYFLTGVDRAFLVELNDTYTFGNYSVAIQITAYMAIFYTAINNTFEPDIYQAISTNNIHRLIKLIGISMGVIILANLIFFALAPFAIGLLTANRYIESAPFARILALQNITMACYYMIVKLFIGYGYVKAELAVRILGAAISVLIYKILIDKFGFYGAAWGQVSSFLILSILGLGTLYFLRNKTTISILMASKKTITMNMLMLVITLIFITPWSYIHYTALILLPIFLAFTGKKRQFYDLEFLLLILFSLTYTLVIITNKDLQLGLGTLLKYLLVPMLCYLAGKSFVQYSRNEKSFIDNLLIILFVFSIVVFLSIAIDIIKAGYISSQRNVAVIGEGSNVKNATGLNAFLSVWIGMFGFVFYQVRVEWEKKRKLFVILMSVLAIAATLRLGSRTGLVLMGLSCLTVIACNFRRYNNTGKVWLIVLLAVVFVGIGQFVINNKEILVAFEGRANSEEHGIASGGGRLALWEYYGSKILDYPLGDMPTNQTVTPYAHNYFIDIARVAGIAPLILIVLFTISVLLNLKKLFANVNISIFIRNFLLLLNLAFYIVFMVEPVIEGAFSLFMLYLFICGITSSLIKSSLKININRNSISP